MVRQSGTAVRFQAKTLPASVETGTEYPRETFEERASKVRVLPVTIQDR